MAALALAGALALPTAAVASHPTFTPPKRFYLALGDSLAYGVQVLKAQQGLPPEAFDTGYVDDLARRIRQIDRALTVVNYGCPGESTSSIMITGGCPWTAAGRALHDPHTGDQLDAAVAFLRDHRGKVSPVTLSLWGNDVAALADGCAGDLGCIAKSFPAWLRQTRSNLDAILSRLRAAAPDAEIIITGPWDSFVDQFAFADPLFHSLDATMARVAAEHGVRFAELFATFNPEGDPADEIRAICSLTLLCSVGDTHPSDHGYQVIADLLFDASGYARLEHDPRCRDEDAR